MKERRDSSGGTSAAPAANSPAPGGGPGLELLDALPERAVPGGAGPGVVLDDRQ